MLSSSLDRPIRLIELSEDEAREKWRALRTPEPFIDFLVDWHVNTPESAYRVLPTVEQLTGRRPRTFAQWASEYRQMFLNPKSE